MPTKRMMGLALAATLTLCAPANAGSLDADFLKAAAETVLYYAICTDKPFTPGAQGSLVMIAGYYGEEFFKRDIEGKVSSLVQEWTFNKDEKCGDARSHWGAGLLPEGESTRKY
jgi:hypothetical protein